MSSNSLNFIVSPLSGEALVTAFNAVVSSISIEDELIRYVWDFGTGELIYNTNTPTFIYKVPGIYTITLSATNKNNITYTYTQKVTADYSYRDYIKFVEIPSSYADPGKITKTPFKIEVLTTTTNKPIVVDLFAANSKSTPKQFIPDKWSALAPTWKFLDKNYNFITSLPVETTPILKNNHIVAVSGTAEFYYVDSMSTGDPTVNCPILISVAVQTSGFSNFNDSSVFSYNSFTNNITLRTGIVWQVNDLFPNTLKISSNYYNPVYSKQWKDIPIPVMITCHSDRGLLVPGASRELSEPLFSYPATNDIGLQHPVILGLSGLSASQFTVADTPLYFQATTNNYRTGGYIYTIITPHDLKDSSCVTAYTTTNYKQQSSPDEFLYPGVFSPNSEIWVSNPENNTLNKITLTPDPGGCKTINFYRDNKVLADGFIKQIEVPKSESDTTINYEISGFSGIYPMAIDPRNYDLIAGDAELDRIYRIDNNGNILKTLHLTALDVNYDPRQRMFHNWVWTTPSPEASSTRFALYGSTLFSDNSANYIIMVGGVIQPSSILDIDPKSYIARLLLSPNYPQENLRLDLIQIFHPYILPKYESTLTTWLTTFTVPASTFYLPGLPALTSLSGTYSSTKFIVSIDGVLQHPDTYTVNGNSGSVNFSETVPLSTTIHVQYIPITNEPGFWKQNFTGPTREFSLATIGYAPDPQSNFIVNVGGKLQLPKWYVHDVANAQLIFNEPLPPDMDISVTQYSLSDDVFAPAAFTPSSITLDRNYNIWVTLYNAVSVLKLDPNLNLLQACVPNNVDWQKRAWVNTPEGIDWQSSFFGNTSRYFEPDAQTTDLYYNEYFAKPTTAETDHNSNCWVTYSHPLCSFITKYSNTGAPLLQITSKPYAVPTSIGINTQNNVWVANFHGSSYTSTELSGSLVLYDNATGAELSSVVGMSRPGYLAIDRYNNVWFTHGLRRIGVLDTKTAKISSWFLDLTGGFIPYEVPSAYSVFGFNTYDEFDLSVDEHIRGLSIDAYNRVWVIDSLQNFAWVISATPNLENSVYRRFKIQPDTTIDYYPVINPTAETGSTQTQTGEFFYRSAQATSDWTGNKWYQKYANSLLISKEVSGCSQPIVITNFDNTNQIRKLNESFNTAEYYQSLALPENLNNNFALFNSFLPAIVGTGVVSANEDIGQKVYERIANFNINHADVDTCGIKQLLAQADLLSVDAADFAATYPAEILNMLDIASIPRTKLWGVKNNTPIVSRSLGALYNTKTDNLTAGTKIVLKSKTEQQLNVEIVPPLVKVNEFGDITVLNIYPASEYEGYGYKQPIPVNYFIYKYEPTYVEGYIENIIDWDSPYTTQSINLSSSNDWYGDEGGIESSFRYLLTKNLFLK
jgi:hypothetical protein